MGQFQANDHFELSGRLTTLTAMPSYERVTETGIVSLYYEEAGSGYPVLLIAPGGMRSTLAAWSNAPWNPIRQLEDHFRVIAMDQRNAGRSTGPISVNDDWTTYRDDQLALMNHLGIARFHVMGMCIGGAYIGGLLEVAAERITSAVVLQTIGLENNREAFTEMFEGWAAELRPKRPDVKEEAWTAFKENMYGSDKPFFSVDATAFADTDTPILALMGNDLYHPTSASRLLAASAPNAALIETWKEDPARKVAMERVLEFLRANTPSPAPAGD